MSTTPETIRDIEDRLRAALAARADLVRPEDLAPLTPVVAIRPRWQSPWVLLATAAVVLLVLGVVLQGLARDPRSDDVAPKPGPQVEIPRDVGRDWRADQYSTPARLDLDGDGTREQVEFKSEKTRSGAGRVRIEATLSGTGRETYGVVALTTNVVVNALDPIDADGDGDEELVLYDGDVTGGPGERLHPIVLDLRDGLLVEAVVEQPALLEQGNVPVPDSSTAHYELLRSHSYWIEAATLYSGRSVSSFASAGMTSTRPASMVLESWRWRLDDEGVLRPEENGCVLETERGTRRPCEPGEGDSLPVVGPVVTETFGVGEEHAWTEGYQFTARLRDGAEPGVVVEGADGRTLDLPLEVADPRILTTQPTRIFYDGASVLVTSASDPGYLRVIVQRNDRLRALEPVGEVPLANDGTHRTWLTGDGSLVTVVAGEDDTWQAWFWEMVSGSEMAALPAGAVCFDDVDDPDTARSC